MKAMPKLVLVLMAGFALSVSCCCVAQGQSSEGVLTCGVGVKGQTEQVRSSAGFTVALTMNADDDHSKNSHECLANFAFQITRPDGTSSVQGFLSSDDEWNRPLVFRIDGFSPDGKHAFIFLSEGDYPAEITVGEYDITTSLPPGGFLNAVRSVVLGAPFSQRLARDCAATLHVIGTTPVGYIVLGTEATDGCANVERWQLIRNKRLADGGQIANNRPAHLPAHTKLTKLEAGTPVETR
jgi:hypothetical protein